MSGNGMSYDFGVQIAKGTVAGLAQTAAGVLTLTGGIAALYSVSADLDEILNKNRVSFGGYVNTVKALQFAQDKLARGQTLFDPSDILQGMRYLQAAGLNARKNFDLINKAADGTSTSFADMASIVRNGDFSALAELGLITDRTAYSFQNAGLNAQMATKQIISLIKQSNARGLFEDSITTIPSLLNRIKQFGRDFVTAIIGDPKDPEGLASTLKKYLKSIADFFNTYRNQIIYYGKIIGSTLKFILQVGADFLRRVFRTAANAMNIQKKSVEEMQNGFMSFNLWLAILRSKINRFFDEYGGRIKQLLKIWAIFKGLDMAFSFLRFIPIIGKPLQKFLLNTITLAIRLFFALLSFNSAEIKKALTAIVRYFRPIIASLRAATLGALEFAVAMAVNPFTWIAAAIIGIGLMIYNWKEVRKYVQKFSDSLLALVFPFALIAKYWNSFVALFTNLWRGATNLFNLGVLFIQQAWTSFVNYLKDTFSPIYTIFLWFSDKVSNIWKGITDTFKIAWQSIIDWFKQSWIGKTIDWLVDGSKNFADSTANLLEKQAKKMGKKVTAKHGVTTADINKAEAQSMSKTSTASEIAAIQGRSTTSVMKDITPPSSSNTPAPLTNGGSTIISKGAVTINVYNKEIDEEKLGRVVDKTLHDFLEKTKLKEGVLNYN